MWEDIGEYIVKIGEENLKKKNKERIKVAEIAIGKFQGTADYLKKQDNVEIIMTDINPNNDEIIKDDITTPNLKLYENIDIIYSIRPPSELQPHIMNLRDKINASLIIKPLFNEDINIKNRTMKLKNYKKSAFYIYLAK